MHVVLEEFPPGTASAWDREYFSRRGIMRGLTGAAPDDLVLISDVDEIPKPAILEPALRSPRSARCLTVFESEAYLHYLNAKSHLPGMVQSPRLLARRYLRDPQAVRSLRPRISKNPVWGPALEFVRPLLGPLRSWSELGYPLPVKIEHGAAWHFASLGGVEESGTSCSPTATQRWRQQRTSIGPEWPVRWPRDAPCSAGRPCARSRSMDFPLRYRPSRSAGAGTLCDDLEAIAQGASVCDGAGPSLGSRSCPATRSRRPSRP